MLALATCYPLGFFRVRGEQQLRQIEEGAEQEETEPATAREEADTTQGADPSHSILLNYTDD